MKYRFVRAERVVPRFSPKPSLRFLPRSNAESKRQRIAPLPVVGAHVDTVCNRIVKTDPGGNGTALVELGAGKPSPHLHLAVVPVKKIREGFA